MCKHTSRSLWKHSLVPMGAWFESDSSWHFALREQQQQLHTVKTNPSVRPLEWTIISSLLKKGTKMKYEVLLVPGIWHTFQDTKLKSGKSLKQMLAGFHFCTQLFSFFLMNMTFINFMNLSWPPSDSRDFRQPSLPLGVMKKIKEGLLVLLYFLSQKNWTEEILRSVNQHNEMWF